MFKQQLVVAKREMKSLILMILTLGVGLNAQAYFATTAQECTRVDLRETFPLKIRNQGNIAWCYANAAADYLQYVYKLPEQISASDIAIQYNLRKWPQFRKWITGGTVGETGFIRSAMRDALEAGFCPERDFPSYRWNKVNLSGKDAGKTEKIEIIDAIDDLSKLQELVRAGIYKSSSDLPYRYDFAQLSADAFFQVLKGSKKSELLNALRLAACEKTRKSFPFEIASIAWIFKGPHAFEHLNAQLSRQMPATVDYFHGVLEDEDIFKLNVSELHTSVLFGRRFNTLTNECQYLIKNSEGRRCSSDYDPRNDCEGGFLWVSERALYRAMVSYEFVNQKLPEITAIPDLAVTDPIDSAYEDTDGE